MTNWTSELRQDLERWESDGGTTLEPRQRSTERDGPPPPPVYPPGYTAQPGWGFRDPTGHYTFHRVYRPAELMQGPASIMAGQLDEGLSFWRVTSSTLDKTQDARGASRRINYAQARKALGRSMTFERFSSPLETEAVRKLLSVHASESTP